MDNTKQILAVRDDDDLVLFRAHAQQLYLVVILAVAVAGVLVFFARGTRAVAVGIVGAVQCRWCVGIGDGLGWS